MQAYWDDGTGVGVGEINATVKVLVGGVEVYRSTQVFETSATMWYAAVLDWPELRTGGGAGISEGADCVASAQNTCVTGGLYDTMVYLD
ncbi:hypothetical protein DV096_13850 [Bradymonadaceae bacterium TMQ3]|nr:hypothetical protein DV096_13850 [Bradymonadaceae bacterium TMQ3]TXC75136.1 hypothetical protein FRC91_13725 [Bradymonadales bacterium TMQ1]